MIDKGGYRPYLVPKPRCMRRYHARIEVGAMKEEYEFPLEEYMPRERIPNG